MDPGTILAVITTASKTAISAFEVGHKIYDLIKDAKKIDLTLEGFSEEIKALASACDVVTLHLRRVIEDYEAHHGDKSGAIGHSASLWANIDTQVQACDNTVSNLKDALGGTLEASHDDLLHKLVQQIRLNMKVPDISKARDRIRSHTASLQIVILCVGIEINYLVPQRTDQNTQIQLAELIKKTDELSVLLTKGQASDSPSTGNELAIIRASRDIISSTESVTSGSIAGDFNPLKVAGIRNWTADISRFVSEPIPEGEIWESRNIELRSASSPSTFDAENSTASARLRENSSYTSVDPIPLELAPEEDTDPEDDFNTDAALQTISYSRESFENKNYAEASKMLREALEMVNELPIKSRNICNTSEICYMLGVCAFHLEKPEAAKDALLSILSSNQVSTAQDRATRLQLCGASHLLAQTYVKLGELEAANNHCHSALQGRRKLLGKTDVLFYESLALMIRVLYLQGKTDRAAAYAKMIPEKHAGLIELFEALKTSSSDAYTAAVTSEPSLPDIERQSSATYGITGGEEVTPHKDNDVKIQKPIHSDSSTPILTHRNDTDNATDKATSHNTSEQEQYCYQNINLKEYAEANDYHECGPMPLAKRIYEMHGFSLSSKLDRALYEGRDDDALELAASFKPWRIRYGRLISGLVMSELHVAAWFGVSKVVQRLLLNGTSISYRSADTTGLPPYLRNATALSFAAYGGSVSTVRLLIDSGALIEDTGNFFPSALYIAVSKQHLDVVDCLLHRGANRLALNASENWRTPFHRACSLDHLPLVAALNGDNICALSLITMKVRMQISNGKVDNNVRLDSVAVAVIANAVSIISYLLDQGVKANTLYTIIDGKFKQGKLSALDLAAGYGRTKIAGVLLDRGAPLYDGTNAATIATRNGHDSLAIFIQKRIHNN